MLETVHNNFAILNHDGHWEGEFNVKRKDGSTLPAHIVNTYLKDLDGNNIGFIGISEDISIRQQIEKKRDQLASRLALATRSACMGIWDWDIQKNELIWDDQMYALYGLQPGEFSGAYEAWLQGVHPADRAASNEISAAAVRGERDYDTEFRVVWPDGSLHWLKADGQVFRDELARPVRMVGINYDITESKQAEEKLRSSEAKFKAVFDNAPVGISLLDPQRHLLESNDMLAQMVRINEASLAAGAYRSRKYIREDGSEIPVSELASSRAIAEQRAIRDVVNGIVLEDGETIWTQVSAAPLGLADPRYVVITQDITARKRAVDELRRSNAELEQFAYVASHDLQEPLRTVAGMVQLLQRRYQGQLDDRADEYIHYAVDASGRMQKLICDLLDFSRVDRKGQSFEPTPLEEVVQIALANLQAATAESQAQITVDPLPVVKADGGQLVQVFQNLLGNAIKFRGEQPLAIHIGVQKIENGWQFAVQDNCIGIDPQYFERIFLLFQRLHTRRKYPGTGIGLALCKKIIERHGGKIWIESAINQGATFFFTLPER
jgi:PAS domain S-box-containing protein